MRKTDPVRQAERRQHILDAAIRCFARNGFHLTRTAEICAEAGMSPGNLFHYFPSKDAIIAAIVEDDQRASTARLALAADSDDAWAALLAIIDDTLAAYADPLFLRITLEIIGEAVRNPALHACVQTNEAARRAALADLLARATARGQVRLDSDAGTAADWLLLLLDGAFGRAMVERPFHPERYRPLLLAALGKQVQPPVAPTTKG